MVWAPRGTGVHPIASTVSLARGKHVFNFARPSLVRCSADGWLTLSTISLLLASPMLRRAMSTSFWPGRQFTQLLREWDTALATWRPQGVDGVLGERVAWYTPTSDIHWIYSYTVHRMQESRLYSFQNGFKNTFYQLVERISERVL